MMKVMKTTSNGCQSLSEVALKNLLSFSFVLLFFSSFLLLWRLKGASAGFITPPPADTSHLRCRR